MSYVLDTGLIKATIYVGKKPEDKIADLQARTEELEKALTTSYDLVEEALENKQYDWDARAALNTQECLKVLRRHA